MTTPPTILLDGLAARHGTRPAFQSVTARFAPGSMTALVGPNGAGKTTLLRCIAGLHPTSAGHIDRGGLPAHRIALLPQGGGIDRGFPIACLDFVALGAWHIGGLFAPLPLPAARAALHRVDLADLAATPIGALSAGQFQRLLFARLIAQDAPVLLLDEPFNAVDSGTEASLLAILRAWHTEGRTIIAVLHDLDLVIHAFPQTLLLARRMVAWGPTATTLTAAHRAEARRLSGAWGNAEAGAA